MVTTNQQRPEPTEAKGHKLEVAKRAAQTSVADLGPKLDKIACLAAILNGEDPDEIIALSCMYFPAFLIGLEFQRVAIEYSFDDAVRWLRDELKLIGEVLDVNFGNDGVRSFKINVEVEEGKTDGE